MSQALSGWKKGTYASTSSSWLTVDTQGKRMTGVVGGTCFRGSTVQQTYLAGEIRAGSLEVAWSEWDLGNCAGLLWRGGQV